MITCDYSREWKEWQRSFFKLETSRTEAAIKEAETKTDPAELQRLDKELESARLEIDHKKGDINKAGKRLKEIDDKLLVLNQAVNFTGARFKTQKYKYEKLLNSKGESGANELKNKLLSLEKKLSGYRLRLDKTSRERSNREQELDGYTAKKRNLQARLDALLSEKTRLTKRLNAIKPGFQNFVRNLPLLDFMNPSLKIRQIVLPDLPEDMVSTQVSRVDRCTTCHLAIDKKGYEDLPQPFTSHPDPDLYVSVNSPHSIDEFGCTICHLGRGRGTSFTTAAHTHNDEKQKSEWEEKYGWKEMEYWETPMLPKKYILAGCNKCHKESTNLSGADTLNRGKYLFEVSGCMGCHKTEGFENLNKPGPDLRNIASKTTREWVWYWLENPGRFRPGTRMPQFFGLSGDDETKEREKIIINSIIDYLFDASGTVDHDPLPAVKGAVDRGKKSFKSIGCEGCHTLDPPESAKFRGVLYKPGPLLNNMGIKTNREWLFNWLKNPRAYDKGAKMPGLRLADQEAMDMTAFLLTGQEDDKEIKKITRPSNDSNLLNKITLEVLSRKMNRDDAEKTLSSMSAGEKGLMIGKRSIRMYGCFGCHPIKGFENAKPIGKSLSIEGSKPVERLDFGFVPIDRNLSAWLYKKLRDPRIFDSGKVKKPNEKLRMPQYHFSDEETNALVTFILSLTKETLPVNRRKVMTTAESDIEFGRRFIRDKGCIGCHIIEEQGGFISKKISTGLLKGEKSISYTRAMSPPVLKGAGEKFQHDWLFNFLKSPSPIRPWLKVRMPDFDISDSDVLRLIRYFTALSGKEMNYRSKIMASPAESAVHIAQKIVRTLKCRYCHTKKPPHHTDTFEEYALLKCQNCHKGETQQVKKELAVLAPDLSMAADRLRPEWIIKWLKDPQGFIKETKMPRFWPLTDKGYRVPDSLKGVLGGSADKQMLAVRDYLLSNKLWK